MSKRDAIKKTNKGRSYDLNIKKNYRNVLRVSAVATPGLLEYNGETGQWSGPAMTIARQVLSRIPNIKKLDIIGAATLQEADELVLNGQVTLNITPQSVSRSQLSTYAALAVSGQALTTAMSFAANDVETCGITTLAYALKQSAPDQGFEAFLTWAFAANVPYLAVVDTPALSTLIGEVIPAGNIALDTTPISTVSQLSTLMAGYAASNQVNAAPCNIVYIGSLPLTDNCMSQAAFDAALLGLRLFPESEANAYLRGWILPKYAPKLLLSLQGALDAWIRSQSDGDFDCECEPALYPSIDCLLVAPIPLLSLCAKFIPDYAVHEINIQCMDDSCHPLSILNNSPNICPGNNLY